RPLPPPSPSCGLRGSFLSEEGGDGDEGGAVGMMLPEKAWRVEKEEGEAVAASKIEEDEDEDDVVPSRTDHDHFVQSFLMSSDDEDGHESDQEKLGASDDDFSARLQESSRR
ncbi:unnamed protein product, partial [Ectocarpus sp. 12 AP-2014]